MKPKITALMILVLLPVFMGWVMKEFDQKNEKIVIFDASTGKFEEVEKISRTGAEWKKILTPEQYRVTREKGTEPPVQRKCDLPKENGIYQCVGCGTDLFSVESNIGSEY